MTRFEVSRSVTIDADPGRVHALVNDFHQWTSWSPWEDVDPDLQRTYTGPDAGVGARYEWSGNRRAGSGPMEITGSHPGRIDVLLTFLKPWKATNDVTFEVVPTPSSGADLTWRMSGENTGMAAAVTRLFGMDRLIGKDFDRGLARLKAVAEESGP